MRKLLTVLPVLLLTGCINDSATFYADQGRDHSLTVRRQQEYFWSEEARYTLVATRLPDCQRQIPLGELPLEGMRFDLFASGDNQWSVRAGRQVWQLETNACSLLSDEGPASGEKLGTYHAEGEKMEFEPVPQAEAPAGADPAAAAAPVPAESPPVPAQ